MDSQTANTQTHGQPIALEEGWIICKVLKIYQNTSLCRPNDLMLHKIVVSFCNIAYYYPYDLHHNNVTTKPQ